MHHDRFIKELSIVRAWFDSHHRPGSFLNFQTYTRKMKKLTLLLMGLPILLVAQNNQQDYQVNMLNELIHQGNSIEYKICLNIESANKIKQGGPILLTKNENLKNALGISFISGTKGLSAKGLTLGIRMTLDKKKNKRNAMIFAGIGFGVYGISLAEKSITSDSMPGG